jgi:hypothetical protein
MLLDVEQHATLGHEELAGGMFLRHGEDFTVPPRQRFDPAPGAIIRRF